MMLCPLMAEGVVVASGFPRVSQPVRHRQCLGLGVAAAVVIAALSLAGPSASPHKYAIYV